MKWPPDNQGNEEMTLRITDVACYPYRIPFRKPFMTAHGTLTHRMGAIVEVMTNAGISGFGEIASLPEFGGGTLAKALDALPALTEMIRGQSFSFALSF